MSGRAFRLYVVLIGVVCSYAVIKRFIAPDSLTLHGSTLKWKRGHKLRSASLS